MKPFYVKYFKLIFVGFVTWIGNDLKKYTVYNQIFVPICLSKLQIQCIFGRINIGALTATDGNKNTDIFLRKAFFGIWVQTDICTKNPKCNFSTINIIYV